RAGCSRSAPAPNAHPGRRRARERGPGHLDAGGAWRRLGVTHRPARHPEADPIPAWWGTRRAREEAGSGSGPQKTKEDRNMKTGWARQFGAAAIAAFVAVGCSGGAMSGAGHGHMAMAQGTASDAMTGPSATKAADLRAGLNYFLGEHILLAASATGAALGGRDAQFKAAATALDANSVDISKAIGSVYGQGAEDAFLPLWRRHIGFVVDYTVGVATKDKAKQDKAVTDLVQYTQDFGAFLASANPHLPKEAVADLVKGHVLTLKDVIDAQAAGDQTKAFAATRAAYGHMTMIADPLAGAIAKQFPDRFPG